MRATVQDACGSADVLRLAEIDSPDIAADEVVNALLPMVLRHAASHALAYDHGIEWSGDRQDHRG